MRPAIAVAKDETALESLQPIHISAGHFLLGVLGVAARADALQARAYSGFAPHIAEPSGGITPAARIARLVVYADVGVVVKRLPCAARFDESAGTTAKCDDGLFQAGAEHAKHVPAPQGQFRERAGSVTLCLERIGFSRVKWWLTPECSAITIET